MAHLPDVGIYTVTSHAAVSAALRDSSTFSSRVGMTALVQGSAGSSELAGEGPGLDLSALRLLIAPDPPEHTRLRRLLSRAFTPRAVAELEPRLRAVCAQHVDTLIEAGDDAALRRDLASLFPVAVIGEALGIPTADHHDFRRWSDALMCERCGFFDTGPQFVEILRRQQTDAAEHADHQRVAVFNELLDGIDETG